ncbi:hypothetical protein OG974_01610 [Streptomyces sp. NBC_00597]|uniref:hypothetical protein n=1 Tax=unclassified Streptomyces TaxID=2593676 RepID=UPI002E0DDA74|nr:MULTISPECIES: hypothetical protein [unclassified Streptomyces]WSR21769.1 hypothetical protein OG573_23270 [Streptomyces sp. NBC_01205]
MYNQDGATATIPHPLVHQQVREASTGRTGTLMDVLSQAIGFIDGEHRYAEVAYVRAPGGLEFTADPADLEPA